MGLAKAKKGSFEGSHSPPEVCGRWKRQASCEGGQGCLLPRPQRGVVVYQPASERPLRAMQEASAAKGRAFARRIGWLLLHVRRVSVCRMRGRRLSRAGG